MTESKGPILTAVEKIEAARDAAKKAKADLDAAMAEYFADLPREQKQAMWERYVIASCEAHVCHGPDGKQLGTMYPIPAWFHGQEFTK